MIVRKEIKKILELDSLAPGEKTKLEDCQLIDLTKASSLALTVRCTFNSGATAGAEVYVLASPDGSIFDTQFFAYFNIALEAGKEVQITKALSSAPAYLKIILINLDTTKTITDIDAWAVIGYETEEK